MSGGALGDRAGCVRRHVLEDPAQPVDDVVIINLAAGHPRRVTLAGVLVAEGVTSHQRMHLLFIKMKATCSALSPASLKALIFASSSGSWIPSYIVGLVFHKGSCFGCFPLGFGSSGWWLVT
jgi:hypothetical protein